MLLGCTHPASDDGDDSGCAGPACGPQGSTGDEVDDVSPLHYADIVNTQPVPAGFRAYADDSPWNRRLPEHPLYVIDELTPEVQSYASNHTGGQWWTQADDFVTTCTPGLPCGASAGYAVYKAAETDPLVTFVCDPSTGQAVYGCTLHDEVGQGFSIVGHIPANARPTCTNYDTCGDRNLAVIQPDGSTINVYGCVPDRDLVDGDVIGTGGNICPVLGGMVLADIVHDKGLNGSVTSGPNYESVIVHYNEIVGDSAEIHHALIMGATCVAPGYVYPGSSETQICGFYNGNGWNGHGVPEGTRLFLDLSHADIDAKIADGTFDAGHRSIYYALHDYGGFILDTAGDGNDNPAFGGWGSSGLLIEDASPWVRNGAHNPWIDWFLERGAERTLTQGGSPMYAFRDNIWQAVAPYLRVVDECYSRGTCSDSL